MERLKHNPIAAAKTGAIILGIWTLLLWIFSGLGFYTGTATVMQQFNLFFEPGWNFLGLILGTTESIFYGGLIGYVIVWIYNKM